MTPAVSRTVFLPEDIIVSEIAQGNRTLIERYGPHLEADFFRGVDRAIYKIFSGFIKRYYTPPTLEQAHIELQKQELHQSTFEEAAERLRVLYQPPPSPRHPQWVEDQTADFIRKQAYRVSMEKADSAADRNQDPTPYLEAARQAWHKQFDCLPKDAFDVDDFIEAMQNLPAKVPFQSLPAWKPAAVARGELGLLIASTGGGKTLTLVHGTGDFLRQNLNVLYISTEMPETRIRQRVAANLQQKKVEHFQTVSKEQFRADMDKLGAIGRLKVCRYAAGTAHVANIEHRIQELRHERFVPDVIVLDYLGEMASQSASRDRGSYEYVGTCVEELQALGVKHNAVLWTAIQANRSGYDGVPQLTSASESLKSVMKADVIVSFCPAKDRPDALLTQILKVRNGAGNPKPFLTGVDATMMTLYDLSDPTRLDQPDRLSQALVTDNHGFKKGGRKGSKS